MVYMIPLRVLWYSRASFNTVHNNIMFFHTPQQSYVYNVDLELNQIKSIPTAFTIDLVHFDSSAG